LRRMFRLNGVSQLECFVHAWYAAASNESRGCVVSIPASYSLVQV
jgi:hypothetical protein